MSVARAELGAASLDNKIYAIGGGQGTSILSQEPIFAANEVYDPLTNVWTTLSPLPVAVKGNTATIGFNGKIYVFGGLSAAGASSLVQIYSVASNTWSTGAPMPTPRFKAMAGVLNGQIVVFGGEVPITFESSGQITSTTDTGQTEIYDPISNSWTIGPAMLVSSDPGQGVTFDSNRIFSIGTNFTPTLVQVLDSTTGLQPSISAITPTSGLQGRSVAATIYGANFTGATSVVFTGSGVTATIVGGGTSTTLPVTISIAPGVATGARSFSVNTPAETSNLAFGFSVTAAAARRRGQTTSQ
jgi:N-acetylneuraminic acid mutarotase